MIVLYWIIKHLIFVLLTGLENQSLSLSWFQHSETGFVAFRAEQWLPSYSCCLTGSHIVGGPGAGNWVGISLLHGTGSVHPCAMCWPYLYSHNCNPTLLVIKSYLHQLLLLWFLRSSKHEWSGSELRCKWWHQSIWRIKKSRWWMSLVHWFYSHRALVSEPLIPIRQAMRAQCLIYGPVTRATHKRGEFEHRAACSCQMYPVWFIVALLIFSLWDNTAPSLLVYLSEWGLEMAK